MKQEKSKTNWRVKFTSLENWGVTLSVSQFPIKKRELARASSAKRGPRGPQIASTGRSNTTVDAPNGARRIFDLAARGRGSYLDLAKGQVSKTELGKKERRFPMLRAITIVTSLAMLSGCSATTLRCGIAGGDSYVDLVNVPQDISHQVKNYSQLCGFANRDQTNVRQPGDKQ